MTILIQRRIRQRYFARDAGLLGPHIPAAFVFGGRTVGSEIELLDALDHMTRAEFEQAIKTDGNAVSRWVASELRNKRLAKRLRTTNKEIMMVRLDEHLRRHGKHLKR
jgi:hypothetical protein